MRIYQLLIKTKNMLFNQDKMINFLLNNAIGRYYSDLVLLLCVYEIHNIYNIVVNPRIILKTINPNYHIFV